MSVFWWLVCIGAAWMFLSCVAAIVFALLMRVEENTSRKRRMFMIRKRFPADKNIS